MTLDERAHPAGGHRLRAEELLRAADSPNTNSDPALIAVGHALLAIGSHLAGIEANTDTFNAMRGHPRHRVENCPICGLAMPPHAGCMMDHRG